MTTDIARLSVASQAGPMATCELCATGSATITSAVTVQHARGGVVRFLACERCTAAVRRLAAAVGTAGWVAVTDRPAPDDPAAGPHQHPEPQATAPELIHERPEHFVSTDGTPYAVRVYGAQEPRGTWISWIEFAAADGTRVLRTERESTQSHREDLVYWASGLEPVYFEGAFARAS